MTQAILANAKLVLPNEVVTGSLVLERGVITQIALGSSVPKGAIDCEGDYVSPGLIELHTDNLERHLAPRPKVDWPYRAAILAHDRELAGCGITTVFDAIRVGSIVSDGGKRYGKYARRMADEILQMRDLGALKISHHIHLRAEICSETLPAEMDEFGADDKVGIVSLMDHTPGQRQFRNVDKFKQYIASKVGLNDEEFEAYVVFLTDLQKQLGAKHEAAAVAAAKRYGATLASHDDTTSQQVAVSQSHGVSVAEFPTTVEAAQASQQAGIANIMGTPNLIRGGSHSGNVAAKDLAERDLLDILSSDYVPASLLQGAMILAEIWGDMPRAMASVTRTPALRTNLTDRGEIALERRADVIRFGVLDGTALLKGVWSEGQRVS